MENGQSKGNAQGEGSRAITRAILPELFHDCTQRALTQRVE